MFVVGLTGGVGSGKSTVADLLSAHDVVLIDADVVAREVVDQETPGLRAIVDHFGRRILTPEGDLDRRALAETVFADRNQRETLNSIIHPLVRASIAETMNALRPTDATVLLSVALMVESGEYDYDVLLVVDVPETIAIERMVARRGWTADEAQARIQAQASRQKRLDAADFVIENSGTLDDLTNRVEDAWKFVLARK